MILIAICMANEGDGPVLCEIERGARLNPATPLEACQEPLPPHLPLTTLKFPHDIGLRQSEMRSFESGR